MRKFKIGDNVIAVSINNTFRKGFGSNSFMEGWVKDKTVLTVLDFYGANAYKVGDNQITFIFHELDLKPVYTQSSTSVLLDKWELKTKEINK